MIYANSLDVPFYLDDLRNISENLSIRIQRITLSSLYNAVVLSPIKSRPFPNASFALNYYFNQLNVFGYHLVNIVIHIFAGFFLYQLFRATLKTPMLALKYRHGTAMALFGALLFLVHPLHTGSVTYIVQRMVTMAALFYILSLLCYIKGRLAMIGSSLSGGPWFVSSFVFFLLAIGSKEIAVTLPFVIFLYEWYFFQDLDTKWLHRHIWIVGLILLVFAVVFLAMGGQDLIYASYKNRSFTPVERLLTQFRVVLFYLSMILFPYPGRMNLDHYISVSHSLFDPVTTFVAAIVLVLLLIAAVISARKQRLLSFAILWYLGNLALESSFIGLELIFEHRIYLPSAFLLFTLVVLLIHYVPAKRFMAIVLLVVVATWSWWTVERNAMWKDPVLFWSDSAKKSPQKARPFMNLSVALREKGEVDAAIAASQRAIAVDPRFVNGFVGLAAAYEAKGELDKAAQLYRQALQMLPDYEEVHNSLGIVYLKQGKIQDAVAAFNESLRLNPNNVNTLVNRASVKASNGDYAAAVTDYKRAMSIGGKNPDIFFNLALTYANSGQIDQAIASFEELLNLNPNDAEAKASLEELLQLKK